MAELAEGLQGFSLLFSCLLVACYTPSDSRGFGWTTNHVDATAGFASPL